MPIQYFPPFRQSLTIVEFISTFYVKVGTYKKTNGVWDSPWLVLSDCKETCPIRCQKGTWTYRDRNTRKIKYKDETLEVVKDQGNIILKCVNEFTRSLHIFYYCIAIFYERD